MSASKRLRPVQQVAESREKRAAQHMGQARAHLAREEAKLEQLRRYHQEYLERFQQAAAVGMGATQLQEYRAFLAKLDEAIRQQEEVVAASQADHTTQKDHWRQKHTRTQALGKVVERCQHEERVVENRTEQKENDERNIRRK